MLQALVQDLIFLSVFLGMGVFLAHRRGRSKYWGLLGVTVVGLLVILFLPKKVDENQSSIESTAS